MHRGGAYDLAVLLAAIPPATIWLSAAIGGVVAFVGGPLDRRFRTKHERMIWERETRQRVYSALLAAAHRADLAGDDLERRADALEDFTLLVGEALLCGPPNLQFDLNATSVALLKDSSSSDALFDLAVRMRKELGWKD